MYTLPTKENLEGLADEVARRRDLMNLASLTLTSPPPSRGHSNSQRNQRAATDCCRHFQKVQHFSEFPPGLSLQNLVFWSKEEQNRTLKKETRQHFRYLSQLITQACWRLAWQSRPERTDTHAVDDSRRRCPARNDSFFTNARTTHTHTQNHSGIIALKAKDPPPCPQKVY